MVREEGVDQEKEMAFLRIFGGGKGVWWISFFLFLDLGGGALGNEGKW